MNINDNKPKVLKWYLNRSLLIIRLTTVLFLGSMFQVSGSTMAHKINHATNKVSPNFLFPKRMAKVFDSIDVKGRVIDENNTPLVGALVKVKGTKQATSTNTNGEFVLKNLDQDVTLIISFLGYKTREVNAGRIFGSIKLTPNIDNLKEVEVVSTGYQTLVKERATGSFVLIDSALLSRKVSTNILERLDGVTSGLIFNKNKVGNTPEISIRGRSTISSNTTPLIILDNFPFDGDISNINPQDVKSISILKDGAAASIWGSRAGNGVIVITTYKGNFNQKPIVSLTTNLTIGNKPDLYYKEQLTNNDLISVEQFLFEKGAYDNIINNGYGSLPPAVEIMLLRRKGTIVTDQARDAMLSVLAEHDNRTDLDKYIYRKSVNQQYQFKVGGGGQNNKYYISLGYDNNLANTVTNSDNRLTLNANNTLSVFQNKLEFYTGVLFSSSRTNQNGINYQPKYPYEKIADENGNALVVTDGTLGLTYIDTVGKNKLLDWHYRPLDEIQNGYTTRNIELTDYRLNLGANYKLVSGLKLLINYSYDKSFSESVNQNTIDSYYTRNQINRISQISSAGVVINPIPIGDIVTKTTNSFYSHYGRAQVIFDNTIADKHEINAIAGIEGKDFQSSYGTLGLYGYNKETETNQNSTINPTANFPLIYGFETTRISLGILNNGSIDRYRSYYFNGSYAYDKRYVFSASARKDESNLFGVKSNQKGVPLWSVGLSWNVSNEKFYGSTAMPYLRVRATYGLNGNVNKSISAYLTALSSNSINGWSQRFITIQNPPNPSLRWEKVKNINFSIDFATKDNILSGSLDFWSKEGIDLIGTSPIAPQTGVSVFTGNTANMRGQGFDFSLTSKNVNYKNFKWQTTLLLNYNTDKITSFKVKPVNNVGIVSSNYTLPLENYSYYSLFSFPWRGLDNQGNPQSILNGTASQDYSEITNSFNLSDLEYSGTLVPKIHGNLMNTVHYKSFEFSVNVLFRLNYVFRRTSLNNGALYSTNISENRFQQADYPLRWQNPGDELVTNVPALIYPFNSLRQIIYDGSSILVEKGDHIRLQDIRLNYDLSKKKQKHLFLSNLNIYAYAANLGIIWKASKYKIDPDYTSGIPVPNTFSIGFKADF